MTDCEYTPVTIVPPEYPGGDCDCDAMWAAINDKQAKLIPGDNITIDANNVISSTGGGANYQAGENIVIENNEISAPNVYSKSATDALLDEKAVADSVYTKAETDSLLDDKADTTSVYTKSETDALLDDKADASSVYTKSETDTLLDDKADASSVYTKAETDDLLDDKADSSSVYTKAETDALLDDKADADSVYTKSETDALLDDKADASAVYTKTETDALLDDKADADSVYTKTETDALLDAKQDTLTAGTGIDITNGVISSTIDADVYVPVTTLPPADEANPNKIYLVPKTGGGVEEWHVIDDDGTPTWDKFGEEKIDLSGYYTKTETDALLDDKADADSVYTKAETDALLDTKEDILTKARILEILGYEEQTLSITDENNVTTTRTILVKTVEE